MKLYIANKNYSSWSLRPWVLMTELGIDFEEELVAFAGSDNYDIFRLFSPSGRVPCLVDEGLVVWDSLAIVEYLAEKEPRVWPAGRDARAWARSAAAEMHSGFAQVRNKCGMSCGVRVRLHEFDAELEAEWARIDELWVQGLARFGGPFLAGGAFTAADAFFAPVVFRVQTFEPPLSDTARDYVTRLLELPSMQVWYEAALQESWRDEDHEAEMLANGVVLADLRR